MPASWAKQDNEKFYCFYFQSLGAIKTKLEPSPTLPSCRRQRAPSCILWTGRDLMLSQKKMNEKKIPTSMKELFHNINFSIKRNQKNERMREMTTMQTLNKQPSLITPPHANPPTTRTHNPCQVRAMIQWKFIILCAPHPVSSPHEHLYFPPFAWRNRIIKNAWAELKWIWRPPLSIEEIKEKSSKKCIERASRSFKRWKRRFWKNKQKKLNTPLKSWAHPWSRKKTLCRSHLTQFPPSLLTFVGLSTSYSRTFWTLFNAYTHISQTHSLKTFADC